MGLILLCFYAPARAADDTGLMLYYSFDEADGAVLRDTSPAGANAALIQEKQGQVNGAEAFADQPDTWTALLTSEGIQRKNIIPGSDAMLADGERPIVLDRNKDYAIDYARGMIKALPGGRMEIGQAATIDFKFANDGPQRADGHAGRALKFDGIDDFLRLGRNPAANHLPAATLQVWVYLSKDCSSDANILVKAGTDRNSPGFGLSLSHGLPQFFHPSLKNEAGKPAGPTTATEPLPSEKWSLLTATYDGKSAVLYINAKEVARQNSLSGNLEAAGDYFIGGLRDPYFFGGVVDEIKIFSRALTGPEITAAAG